MTDGANAKVLLDGSLPGSGLPAELFDVAPLPMVLCRLDDATVLRANRRAVELFAGEQDGHRVRLEGIIGAETARQFFGRLANGGFIDDFEVMLKTSYGEDYCGTISGQIVTLRGEKYVLVGMNDITDRKRAEETLQRFFDGAPLAMMLVDIRTLSVSRINRRASELFAFGQDDAITTLHAYLGSEAAERFLSKLWEGGFVEAFECVLATGWGESLWAHLSGQIIDIGGERCVLIGVRDITELKRWEEMLKAAKEEAEEATRAKSRFLATMSHEIRTPMNGVLGMIDVLATTELSAEQQDMVSVISDSARTLLAIIDDILDLAKIEAGKMSIETIAFGLRQTVATTVDLVTPLARRKGVEIAWRVSPTLADGFLGDPTRLRQVLLNLLSNAVKFTDQGTVVVRVQDREGAVCFEVQDSGIGMSDDQQQRLFQPFSQADASTTRRFGGTGLGLAICKRLVEMMGGDIGLRSQQGVGSVFFFRLPLTLAPGWTDPTRANGLKGVRVLVIDPLAEAAFCIADALEAEGAEVTVLNHPADLAARAAGAPRIDAVVADVSVDPAPYLALPDPPALLGLSAFGVEAGAAAPPSWADAGLPILAKPLRWSSAVRAVAQAVGRERAEADQRVARSAIALDAMSGHRVLVAEDNPTNRIVIGKQLDVIGLAYDMVEDGVLAVEAVQKKSYALLLADCQMPRMDGYALTRALRAREAEEGGHLPIIALTANALAEERPRCLAAGMDDYLTKPVTLTNLRATLLRWLPTSVPEPPKPVEPPPAETAPIPAKPPPLDRAALADLLGDDSDETFAMIAESFLEFFPPLLQRARSALDGRDRLSLRDAAHAAKGAARSACVPALAAILLQLEEKALGRTPFARLQALLDDAVTVFDEVRLYLSAKA
jgi:PAS domain S-box-containing protein